MFQGEASIDDYTTKKNPPVEDQGKCRGGPVQLLLVEYDEAKKALEVWAERLDEVAEHYYVDPSNQVRCALLCALCNVSCMCSQCVHCVVRGVRCGNRVSSKQTAALTSFSSCERS